ncbi:hypothetical protein ACYOEI_37260, partial [Singulisphaera rosea]
LAVALSLAWASMAVAQDGGKPKDDALDSRLEKLDDTKTPVDTKSTDDSKAPQSGAADEKSVPADKSERKSEPSTGPAGEGEKASGEVAPKDKDLDSLLEKLGETPDAPSPDDRPKGGQGPGESPPMPGESKPDELSGKSKDLDEHLEELTGRKPKKKKDGDGDGEGKGPLSDIIKQMREIEERLGKPDTGEETRKKQAEVVKKFDTLIEQVRQSSSQSQSKKKSMSMKSGSQPGSKPGSENPGAMARGAPNTKPLKPNEKRSTAGGKDEWGHLPADLRQELENIFKEEALSSRSDLVRRYFLSLSKKSDGRDH